MKFIESFSLKKLTFAISALFLLPFAFASERPVSSGSGTGRESMLNVAYCDREDSYSQSACKLDIHFPKAKLKKAPVLVWFHGGGITAGTKNSYPSDMLETCAVVSVGYRLSPKIKAHEAIEDAADAIAWIFQNAEAIGIDKKKIFIGGHSAGAYLSGMCIAAPKYLKSRGIENTDIAGAILLSGQTTKHFQVRKDLGDKDSQWLPKIDELSILGNAENKMPPICLIVGDRRVEFPERVEENFLLAAVLKKLKSSPLVEIYELEGLNHSSVFCAFSPIAKDFIKKASALKK